MGDIYKKDGTLNFPISGQIPLPKDKVTEKQGKIIVTSAFCPEGHDLINDVKINNHSGIRFLYTDREGKREAEVVISAIVGDREKKVLSGKPFKKGEVVRVLCPRCRNELPVIFDCECGAHIYLFYIDRRFDKNYGQSFCSRIGCKLASQLRFSCDMLKDFMQKYCF